MQVHNRLHTVRLQECCFSYTTVHLHARALHVCHKMTDLTAFCEKQEKYIELK